MAVACHTLVLKVYQAVTQKGGEEKAIEISMHNNSWVITSAQMRGFFSILLPQIGYR